MWSQVGTALGNAKRDQLWNHPDQLPTAADIAEPAALIARLNAGGDDLDRELRNLLDG
jgi:uncharacterized protein (DUF2342 family)